MLNRRLPGLLLQQRQRFLSLQRSLVQELLAAEPQRLDQHRLAADLSVMPQPVQIR